tara:strand:- start:1059 stop:1271 length:213 start_codon:yes stop_codon:yes gene_type:complete
MTINLDNREAKLTKAEFDSIPRNAAGDITGDLQMLQLYMTPEQRELLSGDDWSRAEDNDEEMRCMMAEFA